MSRNNNALHPILENAWFWYIFIIACVAPLLAHAWLGWYTQPVADDFCAELFNQSFGYFGAQIHFYKMLDGRYLAHPFILGFPLLGRWVLHIVTTLSIASWLVVCGFAFQNITKGALPKRLLIAGVLVFVVVIIEANPNFWQLFYWVSGFSIYGIPALLGIWIASSAYRIWQNESVLYEKPSIKLVASILGFAMAGFSEMINPVALVGVAGMISYLFWFEPQRKRRNALILLAGLFGAGLLIGAVLMILSPGNVWRQQFFVQTAHPLQLIRLNLRHWLLFYKGLFTANRVVFWLFLASVFYLLGRASRLPRLTRHQVFTFLLWSGALFLIVPFLSLLGSSYAISSLPPARSQSIPFVFCLVIVLLITWVMGRYDSPAWFERYLQGLATIILAVGLLLGPIRSARRVLSYLPKVQLIATKWQTAEQVIWQAKQAGQTVVQIDPIENLFGLDQIGTNPENWTSICPSNLYGIQITEKK
jgi:hypothetical protein